MSVNKSTKRSGKKWTKPAHSTKPTKKRTKTNIRAMQANGMKCHDQWTLNPWWIFKSDVYSLCDDVLKFHLSIKSMKYRNVITWNPKTSVYLREYSFSLFIHFFSIFHVHFHLYASLWLRNCVFSFFWKMELIHHIILYFVQQNGF